MDEQNHFYTYDLGCSAALISADFELLMLDRSTPGKVQFVFQREPSIDRVAADYWANRLEVKSRSYFDNLKMLKNRLHSN